MRGAKPQITARILEGLDEFLKSYPGTNVTLARLLEEAGQPLVEGRLPAGQIPIDTVATVLELAARRTRAPCFGLHFARAYPVGATGVLGFMLVNAPDVRAMMACLELYPAANRRHRFQRRGSRLDDPGDLGFQPRNHRPEPAIDRLRAGIADLPGSAHHQRRLDARQGGVHIRRAEHGR